MKEVIKPVKGVTVGERKPCRWRRDVRESNEPGKQGHKVLTSLTEQHL